MNNLKLCILKKNAVFAACKRFALVVASVCALSYGTSAAAAETNRSYERGFTSWPKLAKSDGGLVGPVPNFVTPQNGSEFTLGEDISVEIQSTKEEKIASVTLYINGSPLRSQFDSPFKWSSVKDAKLRDLTVGDYELRVTVKPMRGLPNHALMHFSVELNQAQEDSLKESESLLAEIGSENSEDAVNEFKSLLNTFHAKPNIDNFNRLKASLEAFSDSNETYTFNSSKF